MQVQSLGREDPLEEEMATYSSILAWKMPWTANKTAKPAAEGLGVTSEVSIKALILEELPEIMLDSPKYTEAQKQLAKAERAIKTEKGWWELPSGKLLVPKELAPTLVSQTHQASRP